MLSSVLPFTPEMAVEVTNYCTEHSKKVTEQMDELWDWTCQNFADADKMSSPLQGATMTFLAEFVRARRILEIGCYTGYSALAWYEGTRKTNAEIISLEADPKMIAASRNTFDKYKKLSGQFDIIFVDANKEGYQNYVQYILDHKLLAPEGLIMCDNVFARGTSRLL
ncbi:o-methyltransferase domain-containing protein [Hirsutella rhossiliensis]|uniref:O-methyltransferase domain-containing protein n=1 Tax=Hirsutella rhossiliensis TaxID=111463 RepID=A0A9P8MM71_9HYPO|nr:o-methyltransferase domain-containing protein [Hirsutella rhossiliensis]KAH0957547.1 o-methyltransferase domain-containing protein [Hirsutella rhossiliensis]